MNQIQIQLMQDFSEVVQYESAEIPLYIRSADLSQYPGKSAPCHWHEDIEWILVCKGRMHYYINGKRILLEEGDSLMVNARQMHYGYAHEGQDCRFACILFHPSLFCGNQALLQAYVQPVLKNCGLEYLHVRAFQENGEETRELLTRILRLRERGPEGYELEVIALMHLLWSRLWQRGILQPGEEGQKTDDDLNTQKDMVAYLYQHYGERITLEKIAASGNVSRSKCCRIFRHYLQQSPIDFLNAYRLKVSCGLLDSTDRSVTDIALACGFNHPSYFSRLFCAQYGCTPREYRGRTQTID